MKKKIDIEKILREYSNYVFDIAKQINNEKLIINEVEAKRFNENLEIILHSTLQSIFGEINDLDNKGILIDYLKYNRDEFKDAVLFTFWTHQGIPTEYKPEKKTGKFRYNYFYKGNRWSNRDNYKYFYSIFDVFKNAICDKNYEDKYVPVNYFVPKAIALDINHIKIITSQNIETEENVIYLPDWLTDSPITTDKFQELRSLINSSKALNSSNTEDVDTCIRSNSILNNQRALKKCLIDAFHEFSATKPQLLDDYADHFKKTFNKDNLFPSDVSELRKEVFFVIILYNLYDIPYQIHIFTPAYPPDYKHHRCCLVITSEINGNMGLSLITSLKNIINKFGDISILEEKIWRKQGSIQSIYWEWQKKYDIFYDRYERLAEVGFNICKTFIDENKIKYTSLPKRVKDFQSFFNKIVYRANGRDIDLKITEISQYRKRVLNPLDEANVKWIFENLKDMVGVRIICYYADDAERIYEFLINYDKEQNTKKKKKKLLALNIWEPKDYPEEKDSTVNVLYYRSYHVPFEIGPERAVLYEFEQLKGLKCEIQIRTSLSHGWADVSHHLIYKPEYNLSLKKNEIKVVKHQLRNDAHTLETIDKNSTNMKEILSK